MKKLLAIISAFLLLPGVSLAAISFDTVTTGGTDTNPLTISHTITGNDVFLFCGFATGGSNLDRITGVTYNGVAMTRVDSDGNGNNRSYSYILMAPATGTHDVVASLTGNINVEGVCASYRGVRQTGQPDAHTANEDTGTPTSFSTSITTVATGTWGIVYAYHTSGGTMSAGNPTSTLRTSFLDTAGRTGGLLDTNAAIPNPVNTTMFSQNSVAGSMYHTMISISPSTSTQPVTTSNRRVRVTFIR